MSEIHSISFTFTDKLINCSNCLFINSNTTNQASCKMFPFAVANNSTTYIHTLKILINNCIATSSE